MNSDMQVDKFRQQANQLCPTCRKNIHDEQPKLVSDFLLEEINKKSISGLQEYQKVKFLEFYYKIFRSLKFSRLLLL